MKPEEKMNQIIDTASAMFKEKGYENVSVQDICSRMGFSKPTFYHYVGSKDRILARYFESVQKSIVDQVSSLSASGKDMEALSYGLCSTQEVAESLGYQMFSVYIQYLLMVETTSYPYTADLKKLLTGIIGRLQRKGEITNKATAEEIYNTLIHINQGLSLSWCSLQGSFELRKEFMILAAQVLNHSALQTDSINPDEDRQKTE